MYEYSETGSFGKNAKWQEKKPVATPSMSTNTTSSKTSFYGEAFGFISGIATMFLCFAVIYYAYTGWNSNSDQDTITQQQRQEAEVRKQEKLLQANKDRLAHEKDIAYAKEKEMAENFEGYMSKFDSYLVIYVRETKMNKDVIQAPEIHEFSIKCNYRTLDEALIKLEPFFASLYDVTEGGVQSLKSISFKFKVEDKERPFNVKNLFSYWEKAKEDIVPKEVWVNSSLMELRKSLMRVL